MANALKSVEGLVRFVFSKNGWDEDDDDVFFYRGHSRKSYELKPSVLRTDNLKKNEDVMFHEMIMNNPSAFSDDGTTLEKLVRMQHFSLPTRLLDITENPLVALYFACKSHNGLNGSSLEDGFLITLKIKKEYIKLFNSDTVSCLANLAPVENSIKERLCDKNIHDSEFRDIRYHIHRLVREEKLDFRNEINKESIISNILCVRSKMNNDRIRIQAGAFLLFGLNAELKIHKNTSPIVIKRTTIKGGDKEKILKELASLNITEKTLFPDIDSTARHIAESYK